MDVNLPEGGLVSFSSTTDLVVGPSHVVWSASMHNTPLPLILQPYFNPTSHTLSATSKKVIVPAPDFKFGLSRIEGCDVDAVSRKSVHTSGKSHARFVSGDIPHFMPDQRPPESSSGGSFTGGGGGVVSGVSGSDDLCTLAESLLMGEWVEDEDEEDDLGGGMMSTSNLMSGLTGADLTSTSNSSATTTPASSSRSIKRDRPKSSSSKGGGKASGGGGGGKSKIKKLTSGDGDSIVTDRMQSKWSDLEDFTRDRQTNNSPDFLILFRRLVRVLPSSTSATATTGIGSE